MKNTVEDDVKYHRERLNAIMKERLGDAYDPKIHCCPTWNKDFCQCWNLEWGIRKSRRVESGINGTIKFLNKNKIDFSETTTQNVVIAHTKKGDVFLSLKKDSGTNLMKYRVKGNPKWYLASQKVFLERFITDQTK